MSAKKPSLRIYCDKLNLSDMHSRLSWMLSSEVRAADAFMRETISQVRFALFIVRSVVFTLDYIVDGVKCT